MKDDSISQSQLICSHMFICGRPLGRLANTIFINKPRPLPIHDRAEFTPPTAHPRIKQAPSCQILLAPCLSNSSPAFDRNPPTPARGGMPLISFNRFLPKPFIYKGYFCVWGLGFPPAASRLSGVSVQAPHE